MRLNVRAREPITSKQVELLETFLQREIGQAFTLVFIVGQVEDIWREPSSNIPFNETNHSSSPSLLYRGRGSQVEVI